MAIGSDDDEGQFFNSTGISHNVHFFFGMYCTIFPFIASTGNVIFVMVCISDREYRSLSSTQILLWSSCSQLLSCSFHSLGGIFALTSVEIPFIVNKICGALMAGNDTFQYALILLLALNRTIAVCSLHRFDLLFCPRNLKICLCLCMLDGAIFVAAYLLPWFNFTFDIHRLCWIDSGELIDYIISVDFCETMLKLLIAFGLYLIILLYLRIKKSIKSTFSERKVFFQSLFVILIPFLDFFAFYYTEFIGSGYFFVMASNVSWMFMLCVNPYIYIAVNRTLRQKYVMILHQICGMNQTKRFAPSASRLSKGEIYLKNILKTKVVPI
ncbi:hypothetical protein AB6A40_006399 [Gnathostoma spinigerum]|uniref:G-protein coupled receptors family 1 profile domain-containing protein n=1 Tax=Gnathostoma spinigerum TaxID=75299 RepID=A0ABD6EJF5_9BILA